MITLVQVFRLECNIISSPDERQSMLFPTLGVLRNDEQFSLFIFHASSSISTSLFIFHFTFFRTACFSKGFSNLYTR